MRSARALIHSRDRAPTRPRLLINNANSNAPCLSVLIGTQQSAGSSLSALPNSEALTGMQTIAEQQFSTPPQLVSLNSALANILPPTEKAQSAEAITVGPSSPPLPKRLADRIWKGEYIDLRELLPSHLGVPEPTVFDLFSKTERIRPRKHISSIQDWMLCFNTFISIVAMRNPERVRDLLAYSSLIVKASTDYDDTPWLDYDSHFRRQAATKPNEPWSQIDASLWTVYFSRGRAKNSYSEVGKNPDSSTRSSKGRVNPYTTTPICRKWNSREGCHLSFCRYLHCCIRCSSKIHKAFECSANQQNPASGATSFRPDASRP